ncbi:LmbE-like protein [Neurospora crassa]|uniref:N-acetylglucosaminylphosphatidylinositol deacetylase n=1 Tax=Neurospora crassa (strain ATCC 24698 / 74-OR23-1A / CBS 708.71 / DSM 1257 / FGSC 987) TaxID=367110 RepID=Q7S1Q5_NEUCR|nr:phosphatidylinositol glycan class L [Neurospora crassa OR74A]EAA29269.2 phosphatidylinositol glycan class L [Neurospora crassa OR74A]KHE81019.1 LmbE-like protein [Neurospora crassa]|eukprot:XP_958505.2 phosphatidylinositol glycan class L [Neurospora crassa OR74A]
MNWLTALSLAAVVIPSLYIYTVSIVATRFPVLRNKRICLLIAHPDDEAMFFAPTVLALTRPETGNHIKILCLSSGDAEGLGPTRKRELATSGTYLGLRSPSDVFVIDSPFFPDSMTTSWDPERISHLLASAFAPELKETTNIASASASRSSKNKGGAGKAEVKATIDTIITFDKHGISGHPNHISLYHGARLFVSQLLAATAGKNKEKGQGQVDLYTLPTLSLPRKYSGILDALPTLLEWAWSAGITKKDKHERPGGLVFMNNLIPGEGWASVDKAWAAMTKAHVSQMRWFRYGWIGLSRYMYVNSLFREVVQPATADN